MTEFFSNQLKAVLFLGDITELKNLRQEDGYTIQDFDYQSFRSRDKLGQPYGPSNASLARITLRSISGDGYKSLYNILKQRECYSFSVLYNVKYADDRLVESYDTATVLNGYIVEIEEIFSTNNKKSPSMILNMKVLLHDVNYIGVNTHRRLVVNS
jgi:hypothetical protein